MPTDERGQRHEAEGHRERPDPGTDVTRALVQARHLDRVGGEEQVRGGIEFREQIARLAAQCRDEEPGPDRGDDKQDDRNGVQQKDPIDRRPRQAAEHGRHAEHREGQPENARHAAGVTAGLDIQQDGGGQPAAGRRGIEQPWRRVSRRVERGGQCPGERRYATERPARVGRPYRDVAVGSHLGEYRAEREQAERHRSGDQHPDRR